MKYILIAMLSSHVGMAAVDVEFNSEQDCLNAIEIMKKRTDDVLKNGQYSEKRTVMVVRDAICVPKG